MTRFDRLDKSPFSEEGRIGVAVKQVGRKQRHIGVLYRGEENTGFFCHLAGHHDLCFDADTDIEDGYYWAPMEEIDDVNSRVIAAFFESLRREHPEIPYGFDLSGRCFDDNGQFIPPPLGKGFSCATFVLAVFRAQGFEILLAEEWPARRARFKSLRRLKRPPFVR